MISATFSVADWSRRLRQTPQTDTPQSQRLVPDQWECRPARAGSRRERQICDQLLIQSGAALRSTERPSSYWTSLPSNVMLFPDFRAAMSGPMAAVPLRGEEKHLFYLDWSPSISRSEFEVVIYQLDGWACNLLIKMPQYLHNWVSVVTFAVNTSWTTPSPSKAFQWWDTTWLLFWRSDSQHWTVVFKTR